MESDLAATFVAGARVGAAVPLSSVFGLPGAEPVYPPDLTLEPTHLHARVTVDVPARHLSGRVTTTVRANAPAARELTLHAVDFAEVAVTSPHALTWRYDGEAIALRFDEPVPLGQERVVEVSYRVADPVTGLFFSAPTAANPGAPTFAATDHETERARHWLPCVDLPAVRPTVALSITSEARFTILATGVLQSEVLGDDGLKTAHYRLDQPCPSYLTCFVLGDLVRCDHGEVDGVPIASFASTNHTPEHLVRTFGATPDIMRWLVGRLGHPFPYPKYFQFAVPGIGGAMENISLTSWDDKFVLDERLAAEWGWLVDDINVHEMAHSYFGDLLVCRDFAHAWLKESWATYIEQCWFAEVHGADAGAYHYLEAARRYFSEADERYQRPIVTRHFHSSWEMYDMHLYPGGACRLHTLRHELGDEAFWRGVRTYIARFADAVVETDDFRRVMEQASGRSLGRFFDQWLHKPGYPALKVAFEYDAKQGLGTFTIEQTQVDEAAGVPVFELTLELGWVLDGALQTTAVKLNRAKQTVTVAMAGDPQQVRVDPHAKVLHKLDFDPGTDRLTAQLTGAGDVIGRIQAAEALAKKGRRSGLLAIAEAYQREPFWGVRVRFAEALSGARTQAGLDALATIVGGEADPRVMPAVMRAAAQHRDSGLAAAVQARLARGDLGYWAAEAAWRALGGQRAEAPLAALTAAASAVGYGGFEQSGALRGLAATRHEGALATLVALAAPGACPDAARPAAIEALAEAARLARDADRQRALDTLIDLLRDPDAQAQRAAMLGLEALAEPRAIGPLEAYAKTLAAQDRVRVRKATAAIRERAARPGAAAEAALETLKGEVGKLRDAVDKLTARLDAAKG